MRFYKTETPYTILNWNRETFGERSVKVMAARTFMEIAEFIHAVSMGSQTEMIEELADVAITTWLMAAISGIDARPNLLEEDLNNLEELSVNVCAMQIAAHFAKYLERLNKKSASDAATHLSKALISLEMLTKLLNIDLPAIVDAKMNINRNRKWTRLENGVDQHVS